MEGTMHYRSLLGPAIFLFFANAAAAQSWGEFISQEEQFGINFPGMPEISEQTYELASGRSYPAKLFSATDSAGEYSVIVVKFGDVEDDIRESMIEDAAETIRARDGEITYDGVAVYDGMDTQMIQITNNDDTTSYIAILQPPEPNGVDRLYIAEGRVGSNMPIPGHFQQSLSVVDLNGGRVRYQTDIEGTKFRVIPDSGGQPYLAPECAPGLPCLLAEQP